MKSILLYVHDDHGMEARLQAALDVARAVNGHVECATAKPLATLMLSDPFGASFIVPAALDAIDHEAADARAHIEARMRREDVPWSLVESTGEASETLIARSRLADLIVLSLGDRDVAGEAPFELVGDVAMSAHAPVLAMPAAEHRLRLNGRAVVCWNGSTESADALRAAVPLLAKANEVHVLTIGEDNDDCSAEDAAAYLSRHGIGATVHHETRGDRTVLDALSSAIAGIGADWIVMGAYGSGRLREWLFGGVTRDFLARSAVPIVLTH